jgi:hypothetical protein
MAAENLFINYRCYRETIEAVCEGFPQFYTVALLAFVVETVNSIYTGAFVVAAENEEIFGIFDLVR